MRQPDGATTALGQRVQQLLALRLDYVLHSRQLNPTMAVVFDTQVWIHPGSRTLYVEASDHLPLVVISK